MSRLSTDRLLVSLEPHAVHAVRFTGLFRRKEAGRVSLAVERSGSAPWEGIVGALEQVLDGAAAQVSIVLCNCLVRYCIVAHAAGATDAEEQLALARHQFSQLHGARAQDWHVRVAPSGLASAVDQALIDALGRVFVARPRFRLRSVQPYLMAAFNRARGRLPKDGGWLVLADPERACVALLEGEAWSGVSVVRGRASATRDLLALVAREELRMPRRADSLRVLSLNQLCGAGDDGFAIAMSAS